METDGWTYIQAAWVWTSGVSASQLVWYDLATLFIWTVPLIHFALAYTLTKRESVAAWTAIALTVAGLLTLDNLVYNPLYTAFGRFALFQINVNRQASITLLLPLALIVGLSYLQTFRKTDLVIVLLSGLALGFVHPIPTTILVFSLGITMSLRWLAAPSWQLLRKLIPLGVVLVFVMILPFIQRFVFFGMRAAPSYSDLTGETARKIASADMIFLPNLPILGVTYIRNPASVFYSPVIVVAVAIGLFFGLRWRRTLAAQYVFGTTLLAMILFFTPGITALVDRVGSFITLLALMFILPIPVAFGLAIEVVANALDRRLSSRIVQTAIGVAAVLTIIVMLFEPFPINASPRDQLRAYNDIQSLHRLHPSQEALVSTMRSLIPQDAISVFVTPWDVANVVIEEVPGALITGGRDQGINLSAPGNDRFFDSTKPAAPWLDTTDLEFLAKWNTKYIITLADTTRLPQLRLQPGRFKFLAVPAGYTIYEILPSIQQDADDALYAQMNQIYATTERPRWGPDGFKLILPGDSFTWKPVADQWQAVLSAHPDDDRAHLGLAFTYTMMGRDTDALPLWQVLHDRYPDENLYTDAVASTQEAINPDQNTIAPLIASLDSSSDAARVLATRRLLTDTFFYHLNHEQLQRIFAVTEADAITWDRLANLDSPDEVRKRVALIMNAGEWAKAKQWLSALPEAERAPDDLVAQASIALAMGEVDAALDILRPATDPDQITANMLMHQGRWQNNVAAQTYYLLLGERARRDGHTTDAESAYRQAMKYGSTIAAPYFLSQIVSADQATALLNQAKAEWAKTHITPLPPLSSLLTIADTHTIYAMFPTVAHGNDEHTLTASAVYGNIHPNGTDPIQAWRIQVISPDRTINYIETDVPAQFVDGALINQSTEISIPGQVSELTPALLYIKPLHDNRITAAPATVPFALNRPESVPIPSGLVQRDLQFGPTILLKAYAVEDYNNELKVTLYWQANAAVPEDYQVFVHVLNANGQQVGGQDSAPVDNRYPTSQWRTGVIIADPHKITFDSSLPSGKYTVQIGLYRLSDGARLPIISTGEDIRDNALIIGQFER
jgi:hypothetical protein